MRTLKWMVIGLIAGGFAVGCDKNDASSEAPEAEAQAAGEEAAAQAAEPAAAAAEPQASDKPVIGKLAPDFTLVDETGKSHSLSEYRGKYVVLEWFNIPCPYVRRHYKEQTFDKTIEAVGGDDFVWLAIDTTHDNLPANTLDWKATANENRKVDYPVLQDPNGKVGRLYEAKTTPHMFVIDPQGVLRYMGAIDDDPRGQKAVEERTNYVVDAVKALREGKEIEQSSTTPYGCTVKYAPAAAAN
jgi:peroxiredoxin